MYKDKQKLIEYRKDYYLKNKEKVAENGKRWQENNKDRLKKHNSEFYLTNKERIKKRNKAYGQRIKLEVLTFYSKGVPNCNCCGETFLEFLTIDHINGGGNKHRKEVGNIYRWLINNNYPEGFRVMCINCNFSLGHFGYCPHSK